ncbi:T9SS type A sorting domain-containing protein [Hymenobacter sp. GOD-10R]|uniref:T9SS type A sorting domain-containing protein n=1 Tax=Hymenobacter sp. GOD-10R TaxID=3093922 RepID=UPI002D78526C|nr:T9SS type A sorting domain-containing protein [Hymenobacter sp. GOD-10R]WRQ31110.1 T9SS type A sorting domain-containing protein [Hymenobacter sp. GOD-10R]
MKTNLSPLLGRIFTLIAIAIAVLLATVVHAQTPFPSFPPSNVTAVQDRDQMVWQLGITFPTLPPKLQDPNKPRRAYPSNPTDPEGNWRDSLGNTITRSGFGLWNNYDDKPEGLWPGPEAWRVGNYAPLDLLTLKNGRRITTAAQWWAQRRPEVVKDVQQQLWGVMPSDSVLPSVTYSAVTTTGGTSSRPYMQKAITGTIDVSRYPQVRNKPVLSATLRLPANANGPVPVIIVFNPGFGAQNTILDTYWNYVSSVGWGICLYNNGQLQPDNGTGLTSYLIGLVNKGNWRKPTDWGALVAWSWGVSRLIDYFEKDPAVDATKIGLTGHSRYGKATIVATAYEPRVALAFPSCGGSLGTKMNRRHWGQDVENSGWDQEYHWMAGAFFKWHGPKTPGTYLPRKIEDCPVDAHSLLALCAPRPVFMNGGTQDTWPDPYGIYLTGVGASPVYTLLGGAGLVMQDPKPIIDKGYITGDIGYRFHTGGHTDAPDWPAFVQFGRKYFGSVVLSTKNSLAENNIQVYPNPSQSQFTVNLGSNTAHIKTIQMTDATGRLVRQQAVGAVSSLVISRDNLKAGVYLLRLQGDRVLNQKIVLE